MDQSQQTQQQNRGIRLTVLACVVFILTLLGLFFHKITTPRYLSTIEFRVNGLVLLKQSPLLSALEGGEAVASQLPLSKWSLLVIQEGHCDAMCIEHVTQAVLMLGQLTPAYREKTQLVLIADETTALIAIINRASQGKVRQEDIRLIVINTPQRQVFEQAIDDRVTGRKPTAQLKIIIVDDTGHYRGYFTAPFDQNKMLLTYSSLVEHR